MGETHRSVCISVIVGSFALPFINPNGYGRFDSTTGMELGVVGLGRMGQIVVERVQAAGHDVVAYDIDADRRAALEATGTDTVADLADLPARLDTPAHIWLMVPSGDPVDDVLALLDPNLGADDIIVDGGNSHFAASVRRAEAVTATYLDCGTSGGPAAAEMGFSLMVGGDRWAYEALVPAFDAVATGPDGHQHMGPPGAGHYVKMIHNGIEYALMGAYGEGFELLANGRYDLDLEAIARTWNNGAVIRSWLLELAEDAFREEGGDLGDVAPYVAGGSTGQWTIAEANDQEVPVPLIYQALAERYASRTDGRFAHRLANRLRYGFGRHSVAREE